MIEQSNTPVGIDLFFTNTIRQVVREELMTTKEDLEQILASQVKPSLMQTISLQELKARLGLKDAEAIHKLRKSGAFRGCKIAGKWRFYEQEVVAYIEQQMILAIVKNECIKALQEGKN